MLWCRPTWNMGAQLQCSKGVVLELPQQGIWKAGPLSQWVWMAEHPAQEDCFQATKSHRIFLVVWTCLGSVILSSFLFLSFRMRMSILCLCHHCTFLKCVTCWIYRFTAGEEFVSIWIITWVSPITALDDISMRLWTLDFWVDVGKSEDFGDWWDVMNAFCVWEGHESWWVRGRIL